MEKLIEITSVQVIAFRKMGIHHGSVVERRSPELHTDLVRVHASARSEDISFSMITSGVDQLANLYFVILR